MLHCIFTKEQVSPPWWIITFFVLSSVIKGLHLCLWSICNMFTVAVPISDQLHVFLYLVVKVFTVICQELKVFSSTTYITHNWWRKNRIIEPPHDKTNKMIVCPAKTKISLGERPVWSESSLCAQWVAKDPSFLHADSGDPDQTRQMPRLIWVRWGHMSFCWFCHEAVQIMNH